MKRTLIVTAVFVFVAVSSALVIGLRKNRICDDLFNRNVEALTDGEIIVGTLCMQCPNHACTSLGEVYLDNYPA